MGRRSLTFAGAVALVLVTCRQAPAQVTWNIDNTTNIGGNAVTTVVGSPTVVSTPFGNGLKFDGNDGIIVNSNPVAGTANFTVEMLFRPDPLSSPPNVNNNQPRVLFIQSTTYDHRAALEGRIETNNQQWHIDTFLQSQTAGQGNPGTVTPWTLEEPTKLHPLGQWYNYAMTYDGMTLSAYLNGQLESSHALAVQGMAAGQTSLGMRINQQRFFEGLIAKVRFTSSVVDPANFMSAVIPGDFDRNGAVNAADYDTWKAAFGTNVAMPGDGADGNADGVVDAADYAIWRDHAASGSATSLNLTVPEHSTIGFLITVVTVIAGVRRHAKR